MKNLTKILANLKKSFGFEPFEYTGIVEETAPPADKPVAQPPTDTKPTLPPSPVIACTDVTLRDIIQATVCGESASCGVQAGLRVVGVAYNRAKSKGPGFKHTRGAITLQGLPAEFIVPKQFECWDDSAKCCPQSPNPFSNCANFKKRIKELKGKCLANSMPPDPTEQLALQAIKDIGFDGSGGPETQPGNVKHYAVPGDLINAIGLPCLADMNLDANSKYEIEVTEIEVMMDEDHNPTDKCFVRKYKVRLFGDGCHVFASNIKSPFKKQDRATVVKCKKAAPGMEIPPGNPKFICDKITKL